MPFPRAKGAAQGPGKAQEADTTCGFCSKPVLPDEQFILGTCSKCGQHAFHFECTAEYVEKMAKHANSSSKATEKGKNIARNRPQDLFAQNRTVQRKPQPCTDRSCPGLMVEAELVKPSKPAAAESDSEDEQEAAAPTPAPARPAAQRPGPSSSSKQPAAAAGPRVLVRAPSAASSTAGSEGGNRPGSVASGGALSRSGSASVHASAPSAGLAAARSSAAAAAATKPQQQLQQQRAALAGARNWAELGDAGGNTDSSSSSRAKPASTGGATLSSSTAPLSRVPARSLHGGSGSSRAQPAAPAALVEDWPALAPQASSQPAPKAQQPAQQPEPSNRFAALFASKPSHTDAPDEREGLSATGTAPATPAAAAAHAAPAAAVAPAVAAPAAPAPAPAALPQLLDAFPAVTAASLDVAPAPATERPWNAAAAAGAAAAATSARAAAVVLDDEPSSPHPTSDLGGLAAALRRQQQEMLRGLRQQDAAPAAPAPAPAPPAEQQPVLDPIWHPHTPAQQQQQQQQQWWEAPVPPSQPYPVALPAEQQQPAVPAVPPADAEAELDELLGLLGIG